MAVVRSTTCRSLELGLAMVADQCNVDSFSLDAQIADSCHAYKPTPCCELESTPPTATQQAEEQAKRVLALQQELAAYDGTTPTGWGLF